MSQFHRQPSIEALRSDLLKRSSHVHRVLYLQWRNFLRMFALQSRHFVEVGLRQLLDNSTSVVTQRSHSVDDHGYIF
jgi:hypothetical protein